MNEDLSNAQRRVLLAAASGEICDLANGGAVDFTNRAGWNPDRSIVAHWLGELLSGRGGVTLHPRGLTLRGVRLIGPLNWCRLPLRTALALRDCLFDDENPAVFDQATGVQLELTGCRLAGLSARQLQLTHDLVLDASVVTGMVTVVDAEIGGSLTADGATFGNSGDDDAVDGDQLHVGGHLRLSAGFRANGKVVLTGARIDGRLICNRATFTSAGDAMVAECAQVGGEVALDRFSAAGEVRLSRARIAGGLNCSGARFANPGGSALSCDGADISGDVLFTECFTATGEVMLSGAKIDGLLNCMGGIFSNPGRNALSCYGTSTSGDVLFAERFSATGEVALIGAKIGGQLNCSGGTFANPGRNALSCDSADITGAVFLTDEFKANGAVVLIGAKIGSQLDCSGGKFTNSGDNALTCDHADIGGDVFISNEFSASGEVRLPGAKIGGQLNCSDGNFSKPGGNALSCNGADITGNMLLTKNFSASGEVRLIGARIDGGLDCSGGKFANPGRTAFDGSAMTVGNSFVWSHMATAPEGTVDLTGAHVGQMEDDQVSWPARGELSMVGFRYDRLADEAESDPQKRLDWINRQPGYSPQSYQQLAEVYRSAGQESFARTILIAKQKDLRTRGNLSWYSRGWNVFLGITIGHGYRTARAALVLPVLYLISAALICYAGHHNDMLAVHANPGQAVTSAICTSRYPCLSTWAYPIDYVAPILNLHQAEYWQPNAYTFWGHVTRDWLFVATALGWVATTLVVAAMTGLARND